MSGSFSTGRQRVWTGLLLSALCLSACGGGGGGGGDGNSPVSPAVTAGAAMRTAFSTGSVAFTVADEAAQSGQITCSISGAVTSQCSVDQVADVLEFAGLQPGLYQVSVEVRSAAGALSTRSVRTLQIVHPNVVVFGATPGGIMAAIAAARAGQTVAILEPSRWVGGMMSSGLSKTDIGPRGDEVMGGMPKEFFLRLREAEVAKGVCVQPCDSAYDFEPHMAERLFEEMLREAGVVVERSVRLAAVEKEGSQIRRLVTSRGIVAGDVFIDGSYEGDLMALAGIPYTIGREPRQLANPVDDPAQLALQEDQAGVRRHAPPRGLFVDPYVVPGDASSGTLPYVEPKPLVLPAEGEGDSRVMAYTYRLCVTDDPDNREPFTPPAGYDPARYEASARLAVAWQQAGADLAATMFNPGRTVHSRNPAYFKYDLNGGSTFSTDMTAPDMNQAYVEAGEAGREGIRRAYREYIQGLLYFWQTDPRYGGLNGKIARFGYCRDEFAGRGGWPHQLYVRVARRMLGEYVINQNDLFQNGRRPRVADSVALGVYNIDLHAYRYLVAPVRWPDGVTRDTLVNEGFFGVHFPDDRPYPVPYRALTPRAGDASNFLNPVTLSATNLAYGSLRMEPTFMALGAAAGMAAALAVEQSKAVQELDYELLEERLLATGQRLSY